MPKPKFKFQEKVKLCDSFFELKGECTVVNYCTNRKGFWPFFRYETVYEVVFQQHGTENYSFLLVEENKLKKLPSLKTLKGGKDE